MSQLQRSHNRVFRTQQSRRRKREIIVDVSAHFALDGNLSWKAKGVLIYLYHRSGLDGWQLRYKDLLNRATDGQTALRSGIKELQENGYLRIHRIKDDKGQFTGAAWIVTLDPESDPITDEELDAIPEPHVQNGHMGEEEAESEDQNENPYVQNPHYGVATNSKPTPLQQRDSLQNGDVKPPPAPAHPRAREGGAAEPDHDPPSPAENDRDRAGSNAPEPAAAPDEEPSAPPVDASWVGELRENDKGQPVFPGAWYDRVLDEYQRIKGVHFGKQEFGKARREIKAVFTALLEQPPEVRAQQEAAHGPPADQVVHCMEAMDRRFNVWKLGTVQGWVKEFLSQGLPDIKSNGRGSDLDAIGQSLRDWVHEGSDGHGG